jgi:hypothetical protein
MRASKWSSRSRSSQGNPCNSSKWKSNGCSYGCFGIHVVDGKFIIIDASDEIIEVIPAQFISWRSILR